jgi:diguanylate cyclase (GGDEF)-like protein
MRRGFFMPGLFVVWAAAAALCLSAGDARAACLAEQSGRLAALEQQAFRDPRAGLVAVTTALEQRSGAPAAERAALNAIAADTSRQLGLSKQSVTYANAGLSLLPLGDISELAVRLRTVRALVSTNLGGIDAAIVDLSRLAEVVKARPLSLGCVLRDRGWLHFRDGDNDQALDDLLRAYQLLSQHATREEAMVAAGRLSMAEFSVRDYPQALALVDESIDFFRKQKAPVRLATALDRRASILTAAGRHDEALVTANEALRIHIAAEDKVGTGLSELRLCSVEAARGAFVVAQQWCDRAEATLAQTSGMDDNDHRTLAALRGKLALDQGNAREALLQLDRAIAPGGAEPAYDITELHAMRAKAYAALGNYAAAYAEQTEYLQRVNAQSELDRTRQLAQQRVQFETDREKQKVQLLEKDSALASIRLQSQARATRLAAMAGLAALLTALALAYALLANRRHRAQLITQAERDYLTGLLNRRAIVRAGAAAMKQAQHSQRTLLIGLIDLDHFKAVNDQYGHAVGDKLLQHFALTVKSLMRDHGLVGRYGGEEFLVIFWGDKLDAAIQLAEILRDAVRDATVTVDGVKVGATLSMGNWPAGQIPHCTSPKRKVATASKFMNPLAIRVWACVRQCPASLHAHPEAYRKSRITGRSAAG